MQAPRVRTRPAAGSTAEPHVAVVERGDVIYNSNGASDEPANGGYYAADPVPSAGSAEYATPC